MKTTRQQKTEDQINKAKSYAKDQINKAKYYTKDLSIEAKYYAQAILSSIQHNPLLGPIIILISISTLALASYLTIFSMIRIFPLVIMVIANIILFNRLNSFFNACWRRGQAYLYPEKHALSTINDTTTEIPL